MRGQGRICFMERTPVNKTPAKLWGGGGKDEIRNKLFTRKINQDIRRRRERGRGSKTYD